MKYKDFLIDSPMQTMSGDFLIYVCNSHAEELKRIGANVSEKESDLKNPQKCQCNNCPRVEATGMWSVFLECKDLEN